MAKRCLAVWWLTAALLTGCAAPGARVTPTFAPAPTRPSSIPIVPSATPTFDHAQMLARLRRTALLEDAVGQCAALIGQTADIARVRVETPKEQGCVPCNKLPIGSADRGIPADEVVLPLEENSWIWVTVDDLLCIYLYEGREFKPSSVTHW
ncbi:MAG: hypothetical protein ACP5UQ_14015 [Anaerolineae bacterium]